MGPMQKEDLIIETKDITSNSSGYISLPLKTINATIGTYSMFLRQRTSDCLAKGYYDNAGSGSMGVLSANTKYNVTYSYFE